MPAAAWISQLGLRRWLAGEPVPRANVQPVKTFIAPEVRVGLGRDPATQTAAEGLLFQQALSRPREAVRLIVELAGLTESELLRGIARLGGDGHLADVRWVDSGERPQCAEEIGQRARLLCLSPLPVPLNWTPDTSVWTIELAGLTVDVEYVVARDTIPIGGWGFAQGRSRPLRAHLPAGSVIGARRAESRRSRRRQIRLRPST